MSTHKIPTLAELHQDNPDAYANDQLKSLLNCPPNMAWVKKHPFTAVAYLPIDKVEYMLDKIFGRWRREIKSIMQIEQSVVAIVRLHYWNPIINEWDYHDGTGAMPIQVDKDCKASDMVSIKAAAIQMAAPAAASYALKDAADNLGKLFGRDITRKDAVDWDPSFKENPHTNAPQAEGEKAPPPPPPLPPTLAAKVVEQPTAQAPVVNFTPPAFDASAFAAPVINPQADKKEPGGLDIPLNF